MILITGTYGHKHPTRKH